MKKLATLLACLVLVLGLFVVKAHAVGGDPYSSWVEAQTNYDADSGETYAYATDGDSSYTAYGEAMVSYQDLGARSYIGLAGDQGGGSYGRAYSSVIQQFQVTAAGAASINFGWDGYLGIYGTQPSWGVYEVYYSLSAVEDWGYDSFGYGDGIWSSLDYLNVSSSDSLDFIFSEGDIGSTFSVSYNLETVASVHYLGFPGGDGSLTLVSSFMDTGPTSFAITGITGGLEALGGPQVPLPGAFLLLGSGLLGLIGFARKRRMK
ncbi:MAG: hypothetical protein SVS15_03210 [Thermodesulfobacteriota bacterium]|nr:hypothetical protein [Thermodesulfobacteriota bacterium]